MLNDKCQMSNFKYQNREGEQETIKTIPDFGAKPHSFRSLSRLFKRRIAKVRRAAKIPKAN